MGGRASAAPGVAREGRELWAATPTGVRASTCGHRGPRPGVGPPRSFLRYPPPPRLTCGLSSSVSSMGSLSIPGIVEEGGRRPPTAPHAEPPAAVNPNRVSLAGAAAVPACAALATLARRGETRREIPPPGALIGSRRRPSARRGRPTPEAAGAAPPAPPAAPVLRARAFGCESSGTPRRAPPGTRTSSEDPPGELGAVGFLPRLCPPETVEKARPTAGAFSATSQTVTFRTLLQRNAAG